MYILHTYIHICIYLCMYVHMYVHMCVCMYCMYIRTQTHMYIYTYEDKYVHTYLHVYKSIHTSWPNIYSLYCVHMYATVPSCYVIPNCNGEPINSSITFSDCCMNFGVSYDLDGRCQPCPITSKLAELVAQWNKL